jgi:hypothetical protein
MTLFFSDATKVYLLLKDVLNAVPVSNNKHAARSKSSNGDNYVGPDVNPNSQEILENIKRYYKIEQTQDDAPFQDYLKKIGFIS